MNLTSTNDLKHVVFVLFFKNEIKIHKQKIWPLGLWIEHTTTKEKNKKVMNEMKDELGGKIMKQLVGLGAKDGSED